MKKQLELLVTDTTSMKVQPKEISLNVADSIEHYREVVAKI